MCITHILHMVSHAFHQEAGTKIVFFFFYFGIVNKYLMLALPLLFFCVLLFLV